MIRKWMFAIVAFTSIAVKAQVGIGTVTPNALLELQAKDSNNPTNSEGILIPRVKKFPIVNPEEKHHGLLVFLSENTATHQAGFYHWSHTKKIWTHVAQDYGWSLKGNAGTDPTINFIGTTDNKPLVFKANNTKIGLISQQNIAFGVNALEINTSGSNNVALNTSALAKNTTGNGNVAIGATSMLNNSTGNFNIGIGFIALSYNETGKSNIALGSNSGVQIKSATHNIAIGNNTFHKPGNNTFLEENEGYNIAIGEYAGYNVGFVKGTNTISIGENASADAPYTVRIGNTDIVKIEGQVPWSNTSDSRVGKNIQEDVPGLDFITKLRPVTFNFNTATQKNVYNTPNLTGVPSGRLSSTIEQIKQTGFIGQEVETAANAIGYNFSGVNKPSNSKGLYSLSYATFVVPLVKAVQEQQKEIETLNKNVTILEKRIQKLEDLLRN
jgi:trimeric autotransporter adhesin